MVRPTQELAEDEGLDSSAGEQVRLGVAAPDAEFDALSQSKV